MGSLLTQVNNDHNEWVEWEEQCRRQLQRPMALRLKYGWIRKRKPIPILDDVPYRSFETTEKYRTWCEEHLPEYLGYGRAKL
jgi:hypothetical protein